MTSAEPIEDLDLPPPAAAERAGLRYAGDHEPGIRRLKARGGFRYVGPDGRAVRDAETLGRIRALAIPPAWTDVWICADADGHVQAVGRDARRRKQYRYHPRWREVRDETKYHRMLAFGAALPALRERVTQDMSRRGLPREKVLAAVVRLIESTLIRVGNDEYARDNDSYGAATLRDEHVDIDGATMVFHFRGKAGKIHEITYRDRRLARIVRSCQELPGQALFQYVDDEGRQHDVGSSDINGYLREITGSSFTAKDFRTWAATVLAAMALGELGRYDTKKALKGNLRHAIEGVAGRLGNTPAICRKCYVHPEILAAYADGSLLDVLRRRAGDPAAAEGLSPDEAAVLDILGQRLVS